MLQVIFRIPIVIPGWFPDGIPVYGFGMMLFLAFVLCTWLGGRRGEREGITKESIQDLAIWIFAGGLLGARICYLLNENPLPNLGDFFARLPRIWDGGIILYGGVIGGVFSYFIAHWFIFRHKGVQTRRMVDAVAPCVALGLMLGRLGCFLNGCCFGGITCAACLAPPVGIGFPLSAPPRESLVIQGTQTVAGFTLVGESNFVDQVDPASQAYEKGLDRGAKIVAVNNKPVQSGQGIENELGLARWKRGRSDLVLDFIPKGEDEGDPKQITIYPHTLPLYPTQIYEVISMALLMLVLLAYERFRRNPGQLGAVLMVGYGIHRFLNEILRDDARPVGFERFGSVILVALGIVMWAWLQYKKVDAPVEPVGDAAKTLGLSLAPAGTMPVSTASSEAISSAPGVTPGP